ncbi:porin [Rasiella sp. SM2506]|uniref:porin n=1 Tax=Rasiella sp. SM2506 TaxID=3423914 RepID=UPI003D79711F
MKLRYLFVLLACITVHAISAQEISDTKFGKGLINFVAKDSSFSVQFAPRIQGRYSAEWNHDGTSYGKPEYNFSIRRARLKFAGFAYSPKLNYKIELGLSNRDISGANQFNRNTPRIILDAVIMWNFYENFEVWAGQTKLPGNVERVVSSANLQLIDRSLLNSNFNIDRDVGVQVRHETNWGGNFWTREKTAVSQGEGRNISEGNEGGLQYTGRLEFLPFGKFTSGGDYQQGDLKREQSPKLMVGVTYDYNNNAVKTRSNLGSYMFLEDGSLYETDITTLFADVMFKYKGFALMAEYASRDADTPIAVEADGTATGDIVRIGNAFNIQTSYLFKNNYEITGRYTTTDFKSVAGKAPEDQYTLGVSKYIVGHKLKVQGDISYTTLNGNEDNIMIRTGFELHF